MKAVLKFTIIPLISLFIFMLGNGLFSTLLAIRLHHMGATSIFIGAMTGAFYAGLAFGAFQIERYILKVGHIRAFSAFASLLATISFAQGVFFEPISWLILRFIAGFATAGIFITIESWLLAAGSVNTRGQILACYMIALYGAQASGQFMVNLASAEALTLFALTAMLCSLSVIPVALTKTPTPEIHEPSSLNFKKLLSVSSSAVSSSLCSGLILGSLYGLLPLAIIQKTGDAATAALSMALVIFGGMSLQYPVGRISDFVERRLVLLGLALLTVVTALLIIFSPQHGLKVILFLFGGLVFTLYPVSISHACDNLDGCDIVSGTQGILLAYSFGATIGPLMAPAFMRLLGYNGLFFFIITAALSLALFLGWRKTHSSDSQQEDTFVAMPQTSPVTAEMDPRSEDLDLGLQQA